MNTRFTVTLQWRPWLVLLLLVCCFPGAWGQRTQIMDSSNPDRIIAIAGAEYKRSPLHQWMWGKDYRREWTTPVPFPVLNLDSAYGGFTVLKEGGGRQTKTLHLQDASGKRWVLRSVNKTYLGALPEMVQGTFVENIANDQIATNHPYAALAVPPLAEAAGVYHTNPRYFIIRSHPRLGEYNEGFANTLCMLEERPDESQIDLRSFGRPKNIVGTDSMLHNLAKESDHLMDQAFYLRSRLFDMFIGDWGRNPDNWRWAKFDSGSYTLYRPIPRDRDQTWARFEGTLLNLIKAVGKFKELQTFGSDIKNIPWFNYPAFSLDKRFTNNVTREAWLQTARDLQRRLTDGVIERAVRQMPPEIFAISGEQIVRNLKSRRNSLIRYAEVYYTFLARDVEVPGSREKEVFEVNRVSDSQTEVKMFRVNRDGSVAKKPLFSRVFNNTETEEIRLFGIGGNDVFNIKGDVDRSIKVRVIGGPEVDTLTDISQVGGWGHKTKYYDNPGNLITTSSETKVHLSALPSINRYEPEFFRYTTRGIRPTFYFNTFYRFYVGARYSFISNRARNGSFTTKHQLGAHYSLIENSVHAYYLSSFQELLGRWNLNINVGYDGVRRINFFGTGNNTQTKTDDISYYWTRLRTAYGSIGVDQTFRGKHNLSFDLVYDANRVIDTDGKFVSKIGNVVHPSAFNWKHFIGPQFRYTYTSLNDRVVPTKGITFQAAISYTNNFNESNRSIRRASSALNLYFPLGGPFSVAIKSGGATVGGDPEFYQLNNLGGFYNLRGYWRFRYWGRTVGYNQNELRWLPMVHGHLFTGRLGLVAFFDQGRVWEPGETSNQWHYGYGGGVILVPFNRFSIAVTQGFSKEGRRTNIRLGRFL